MIKLFIVFSFIIGSLQAENNATQNSTNTENNSTMKTKQHTQEKLKKELEAQQIKEQMKLEEKYAKEQRFYQGDEYDLKAVEINKKSLENIPVIEPEYDFDMTDVYRDDI